MPIKTTRFSPSQQGPRPKYPCFDCGALTGSPFTVFRRSDGLPIDWAKDGREGAITVFVHRPGQGCHKAHSDHQVRSGGAA